jgi:lipopolysaccharide transport system permease protein
MKRDAMHFIELLVIMTEKELRTRYKNTVFGFLWILLNPILQMITIGFIFTLFISRPVDHYYYFLFVGLLVWNFFSLSLTKSTSAIVFERSLIKKAYFPHAIIPLSIIGSNLVHFLIALLLCVVPVLFLHTMSVYTLFIIIEACCLLVFFTIGLSLLTSALNVQYRDVSFFVQALLAIWFYATPIVYSINQIPDDFVWIWNFNPLTVVVQLIQSAFLGTPSPRPDLFVTNLIIIAMISCLGAFVFHTKSKYFDDWL